MENILNSELFKGINEDEYDKMMVCFHAEFKYYTQNEIVFDFTKGIKKIGIINDGVANLVRIDRKGNRSVLEILKKNDLFGEVVAFSNLGGDSLFIEAATSVKVIYITNESLTKRCENACNHHSRLVENLLGIVTRKTRQLSERLEVLSNRTIRDKLLCYFNILAEKEKSTTFNLPFSLTMLSDYICSDRSAVMRELKNMKDEGLINTEKKTITLI